MGAETAAFLHFLIIPPPASKPQKKVDLTWDPRHDSRKNETVPRDMPNHMVRWQFCAQAAAFQIFPKPLAGQQRLTNGNQQEIEADSERKSRNADRYRLKAELDPYRPNKD
jgi:hypothetical protein